MWKKPLALLLIAGWVILSGFDLVEDLDQIPGKVVVSSASPLESSTLARGGWGPIANNIVESANRISKTYVSFASVAASSFTVDAVLDFPRHFRLYKFYRVFLI
ncbi:MAG: hypothetical protein FJ143_08995 [Deltaproteobacteria bacterium]|nr:hypothetical protein [Deltaproteobacteria bacterium]